MREMIGETLLYIATLIEDLAVRIGGVPVAQSYIAEHTDPRGRPK